MSDLEWCRPWVAGSHCNRQPHLMFFGLYMVPKSWTAWLLIRVQKLSKEMFWPLWTSICCRRLSSPVSLSATCHRKTEVTPLQPLCYREESSKLQLCGCAIAQALCDVNSEVRTLATAGSCCESRLWNWELLKVALLSVALWNSVTNALMASSRSEYWETHNFSAQQNNKTTDTRALKSVQHKTHIYMQTTSRHANKCVCCDTAGIWGISCCRLQ